MVGYRPGLGRHQAELDVGLLPGAPRASWIGRRVPRGFPARISRADFSSAAGARARQGLARCWRWAAGLRTKSAGHRIGRISHWSNRPLVKSATGQESQWPIRPWARGLGLGAAAGPRAAAGRGRRPTGDEPRTCRGFRTLPPLRVMSGPRERERETEVKGQV